MKQILLIVFSCLISSVFAQSSSYSSKVLDLDGDPVPGATVVELGTQNYAVTDVDGKFMLNTEAKTFTLQISSLGFETTEIEVNEKNLPPTISFKKSTVELNEVVITALGIERSQQSLSSSVTKIDAKELSDVLLPNLVNSLSGQVAGVQITNGSSGAGSSARIVIRGENSLSGSNQPLFVVDGVPIHNEQITSDLFNDGGNIQEVDFGNGAADIDPDNIESISVLKGPGSAALYGSRAANGVILITTKRGQKKKGLGITTSSSITFDGLLTLPDYQNKYGGGNFGLDTIGYKFVDGTGAPGSVADGGISSFGNPLDIGLNYEQFDSPSLDINGNPVRGGDVIARTFSDGTYTPITATPWISRPDNVRDFYETGVTSQHNIAVSSRGDFGGFRVAYSNFRNEGVIPNTNLERDGIALSFDQELSGQLKVNGYLNFVNSRSDNRPNLGYGYENVQYGFNWTGRQTDISALKDYWQSGQEGVQHYDFNYLWLTNPYLTLFENTNSFNRNRLFGNTSISYDFTEKLSLNVRGGVDTYADQREFKRAFSTNSRPFGGYREDNINFLETNFDFLLSYTDRLNSNWKYTVSAGGNRFNQEINYDFTEAGQLAVPGIYTIANSRVPLTGNSEVFNRRINSLYGIANFSYKSTLYFDLNLRNDWSSTLPEDENSFAYYSLGASYILSNVLDMPEPISYMKFRISAASVGNDTDPYQLSNTFQFNQNYGAATRVTNEDVLRNSELIPERLNAIEAGTEIWFFKGRLQLDVAAYQNTSINQIIGRPISEASGFSNNIENGGEVRTRGLELRLSGTPIKREKFQWKSAINYFTYESVVTKLPEGVDQYVTGTASVFRGSGGSNTVFYIASEGGRVGDMYGTGFKEVNGQTLYENGLPVQDDKLRLLGNYNPDFILGFSNQFNYGAFTLSVLVDWRFGGVFVSRTKALGSTSGVLEETLLGRENGVIGIGVKNVGTEANPVYAENDEVVAASAFYNNNYDRGNEASAIYDASYLKLRQVSLYYELPEKVCEKIGFQNIKVGLVGSNLFLITENPHVDPELNAIQGRNITYGVEDMSYPSIRSFGFSLKTAF